MSCRGRGRDQHRLSPFDRTSVPSFARNRGRTRARTSVRPASTAHKSWPPASGTKTSRPRTSRQIIRSLQNGRYRPQTVRGFAQVARTLTLFETTPRICGSRLTLSAGRSRRDSFEFHQRRIYSATAPASSTVPIAAAYQALSRANRGCGSAAVPTSPRCRSPPSGTAGSSPSSTTTPRRLHLHERLSDESPDTGYSSRSSSVGSRRLTRREAATLDARVAPRTSSTGVARPLSGTM